jgi:YD repeat-containing protein
LFTAATRIPILAGSRRRRPAGSPPCPAGTPAFAGDGDWAAFAPLLRVEQACDAHARPTVQRLISGSTTHALTQTSYSTPLVASRRLRDTTSIGYSYDNLSRLTAKTLPSTPWYNIGRTYTYDNFGRVLTANGYGQIAYVYDALGRQTSEATPFGTSAYQYDAAGRRTRLDLRASGDRRGHRDPRERRRLRRRRARHLRL